MSTSAWMRDSGVRLALGGCALGVLAIGWSLVGAFRVEPLAAPSSRDLASMQTIAASARPTDVNVDAAIDDDLFEPDRTAPAVRYRMPTEGRATEQVSEPEKPVVLGTAVATDGRSFATVKLGDGNPTLVHVGERIGEWTVRAIQRGQIVLVSATGARANLAVPKPGT